MYKQVIVIRNDIEMSAGKTAAQAAHASYSAARKSSKTSLEKWESEGQKKVVLKAGAEEIRKLVEKCSRLKVKFALIADAGLTELEPGTVTALGIGPEKGELIDKVTGSLPLLD